MIAARALLLVLVIIVALFAFAAPVEAQGTPAQLIVFTDRDVYLLGEPYEITSGQGVWTTSLVTGIRVKAYVAILDDDGNLVRSLSGLSLNATIKDNARYYHNASTTYHSDTEATNGKWWNTFNTTFTDTDGDGIWETTFNLQDAEQLGIANGVSRADQFNITVTVNETTRSFTKTTYALFSRNGCGHGNKGIAALTAAEVHTANGAHPPAPCTVCHWGWEHKTGVHGNNTALGDNVSAQPDISFTSAGGWNYNTGTESGTGATSFRTAGRADICIACHNKYINKGDVTILDMDPGTTSSVPDANGDGINDNDRPSCSWAQGATALGTWSGVGCHDNGAGNISGTIIEKVPLKNSTNYFYEWLWKENGPANTSAHNRTKKNVACELCHGNHEIKGLPNASASRTNINEQCWLCHNITGGLNITANGGTNVQHSSTNCKSCHNDASSKLDVHLVPQGASGGGNCTECHNAGNSPPATGALINFSAMNDSLALHKNLNKDDTSNVSRPSENRKCWACHGNGSDPGNEHPTNYKTPYNCTNCHVPGVGQNMNFTPKAILNVTEHYWNGTNITTSAVISCYACHNKSEMMLGSFDPDGAASVYGGANGGNNSSSHYGKKRADLRAWDSGKAANCSYCHQNSSTAFSSAMLNAGYNSSIKNHSLSNSPSCTNSTCHNSSWLHNSTLTKPALPLPNTTYCQNCHAAKQEHNGTQQCSKCHINQSSNDTIHPIKYIQTNGTYSQTNASAANCTNCHQTKLTNFSTAPIIPDPLKHSSNLSNGTIWGTYWASEQGSCYYCHNDTRHNATAIGDISRLLADSNNTKNGALTTTTWCADCHYNTSNNNYKGNQWNTAPPLITVNNTGKSNWENHTNYVKSGYKDSNCNSCHALNVTTASYLSTSLNYSHSLDTGVSGGPNCISCHYEDSSYHNINVTALNLSIHYGVNQNNATSAGYASTDGACWACHDSDGNVTSGMGDRFDTPYNCTSCHLSGGEKAGAYGARLVTNHYKSGTNITARGSSASDLNSCIDCHENISSMLVYNNDTDTGSFAGDGINVTGGASSFYHYGKNRTSFGMTAGSTAYCTYCHNSSGEFANVFLDSANRSIQNHSTYASTPGCNYCHNSTGAMLHDNPILKPSFTLDSSTYCLGCHGLNASSGGTNYTGTVTGVKDRHNSSLNCTQCHINSTRSIHPVRYLAQDGSTWSNVNTSAVNCTNCHQTKLTNFSTAPQIPDPLKHSSNLSNGTIWGTYWTTEGSSCYYCHNDTRHNATAIGDISRLLADSNNTKNGALTTTTWCADCHYNTSNSNYKGSQWSTAPPLITVNNTGKSNWKNHSSYLSGIKDSDCKSCHALNGSFAATSLNYTHSLNEGAEGGPDCVSSGCHGTTGSPSSPYMNWTSLKSGMHAGLNSGATNTTSLTDPIDKACWACHGDGNEPSGHPSNYKQPYNCTSCHLSSGSITGKYQAKNVTEHQHVDGQILTNSSYARCENCHNNSLASYSDNETSTLTNYTTGNVSHYGANKTEGKLMEPGVNSTNCVYCHLNNSNRQKWANATNASATKPDIHGTFNDTTASSKCWECHVDGGIATVTEGFTLHNSSLNPGASEFCLTCHVTGGSAQNLNITGERMGSHITLNNTPANTLNNSDCWTCHYGYPNGTSGSHSYNVSSQNTYYCEDCHGPNKDSSAVSKGIAATNSNIYNKTRFVHGTTRSTSIGCGDCHLANETRKPGGVRVKIYHNDSAKRNASGVVSNPGWDMIDGLYTGCLDCHRVQNTQDSPFHAPGVSHEVPQSKDCGNNCHAPRGYKQNPHYQFYLPCGTATSGIPCDPVSAWSPPEILNLSLSSPKVIKSISTITNLTALARDNYNAIENGKYRILNSSGAVAVDWSQMSPVGVGNDWGPSRTENIVASIDTTPLSPGNYTVEIKAMAGGPRTGLGRVYPDNGEWSSIYSIALEVTP